MRLSRFAVLSVVAAASYEKALSMTEDEEQKKRIRGELAKRKPEERR